MAGVYHKINEFKRTLSGLAKQYEDAIVKDPSFATKIEAGLRISSYVILGRLGSWRHLSEFAYCVSNLFTLFNDYLIIAKCPSASPVNKLTAAHRYLLWAISVLEYLEVVAEVSSEHMWREAGKWFAILLMRLVKLILQCVALFKYKSHILASPAVPRVDRNKVKYVPQDIVQPPEGRSVAYVGRRSGKIIRSIYSDPAIPYSELPSFMSTDEDNGSPSRGHDLAPAGRGRETDGGELNPRQLLAEVLHISRPLVHIFSMGIFQQTSWKPWILSLLMDVTSLHLHGGLLQFRKNREPSEVLRRRLVLLLYLLRSPFFDNFTKNVLLSLIQYISAHVPLTHWILDPVSEYLPVWQQLYSYSWMS